MINTLENSRPWPHVRQLKHKKYGQPETEADDLPGMIDPKKWPRYYDRAFDPTPDDPNLNRLECNAYINYLDTVLILMNWDLYPTFPNDKNLTNRCQRAYQRRVYETRQLLPAYSALVQSMVKFHVKELNLEVA